jgi:hypothetical protein
MKPDVWKYHLRQMAAAEDPFVYLRRFLPMPESNQEASFSKQVAQA